MNAAVFSCCQPPAGINSHRGPRLGTPEEKQVRGGLMHLSNMGSHPGSLPLGQISGPSQDGNMYSPTQFQPGFIPPRHGGVSARSADFPGSSEIPPSHMYRSYKYLNRVHPAVWNGNHGAANPGSLGPDEKPPMGPGPSQTRTLGHMMDSRVMRPPLPPNQWTEQSSFLPHGVPSSGYMRTPCKSGGPRLQPPVAPSPLFGAPSQVLRGVQGGDSMMDSPEMIAMQQLSSRVCPPGVPYHPQQPTPPHLPGPFAQVAHSASANVPAPKPALGNPGRTQDNSETQEPENDRGNLYCYFYRTSGPWSYSSMNNVFTQAKCKLVSSLFLELLRGEPSMVVFLVQRCRRISGDGNCHTDVELCQALSFWGSYIY